MARIFPYSIYNSLGQHVASIRDIDDAAALMLHRYIHGGEVRIGSVVLITAADVTGTQTDVARLISERHAAAAETHRARR